MRAFHLRALYATTARQRPPLPPQPVSSRPDDDGTFDGWAGFLNRKKVEFRVGFSIGGMLDATPPDISLLSKIVTDLCAHRYSRELMVSNGIPQKLARSTIDATDATPSLHRAVVDALAAVDVGELSSTRSFAGALTAPHKAAAEGCAELCAWTLTAPSLREDAALTAASCSALHALVVDAESSALVIGVLSSRASSSKSSSSSFPAYDALLADAEALHGAKAEKQAKRRAKRNRDAGKASSSASEGESAVLAAAAGSSEAARDAVRALVKRLDAVR